MDASSPPSVGRSESNVPVPLAGALLKVVATITSRDRENERPAERNNAPGRCRLCLAKHEYSNGGAEVGLGVLEEGRRAGAMTGPDSFAREALAHVDALYNHARRMVRNAADADELVQETYVHALAGAHTFVGGNLKGWLFRILQNTHIDMHRRNRRQPALGDCDISDDVVEANLVRNSPRADELRGLVTEEIEAALASLSDDARTIVLLDLEGFTESEVAEVIDCPVGTVKSRLSRARAILRERLSEHAPPSWRRDHTKTGER
jgi:RNA polymerase sigma-70 factor (ECF subfamily)